MGSGDSMLAGAGSVSVAVGSSMSGSGGALSLTAGTSPDEAGGSSSGGSVDISSGEGAVAGGSMTLAAASGARTGGSVDISSGAASSGSAGGVAVTAAASEAPTFSSFPHQCHFEAMLVSARGRKAARQSPQSSSAFWRISAHCMRSRASANHGQRQCVRQ